MYFNLIIFSRNKFVIFNKIKKIRQQIFIIHFNIVSSNTHNSFNIYIIKKVRTVKHITFLFVKYTYVLIIPIYMFN